MIDKILRVCRRIKNGRDINTVDHAIYCELGELQAEQFKVAQQVEPGPDGVVGEAVDVILCLVDLIYQYQPDIGIHELNAVIDRKLYKWESLYGTAELAAKTMASK
jgi:hypothetical protein